jgi:tRNA/tmRNA/rRNA uracil-C5-methylase (TrmA/RlmC/RlmD family)
MGTDLEKDKSLDVGKVVTVEIRDVAFGGDGVARFDELVIFVPFVDTGELVKVEIVEVKKNYCRGKLLEVLKSSPDRVEPVCKYFGKCGGCQYQHLSYSKQLRLKQSQVIEIFKRLGKFDVLPVNPIIPCPMPYGYRNRIMIRSQLNKKENKLNIGFLEEQSRIVVDIEECKLADAEINKELMNIRSHFTGRGGIKKVLRILPEGWEVPEDSFFQNNFYMLDELVKVVKQSIDFGRIKYLVDAYCGVGFFGVSLAQDFKTVVGVECDRQAINAARLNARHRGFNNVEFIDGKTEEWLPVLATRFPANQTAVLLDPPRTGCAVEVIRSILKIKPAQVIYVSCNPATLARDLNTLCDSKVYRLSGVTPLDLFPQTQHIECIAEVRTC